MKNLVEKKQELYPIIDGYAAFLERQKSEEYNKRGKEFLDQKKIIDLDRYHIALIGYVNRGKSTLLNALLGDRENNYDLSPVKVLSTTAAIVMYIDSKLYPEAPGREGAIIRFSNGNSQVIEKAEISQYVDQNDPGFIEDRAKEIDHIEVYGNFPRIENRGVIVDTPGMGALYDQDYLAQNILSEVDVILCPVAADYPLSRDESVFLVSLPQKEKDKLMYVLTKVDGVVDKDELRETASTVQEAARSISGGTPRLYQVAAKNVLDAYKAGKSDMEIEQVKKACGMKALEDALDEKLRNRSQAEERIRLVCNELESCFGKDKSRLTEMKENLSRQSKDLEEERKRLETTCQNIKTKFDKNIKKLKQQWEKVISRFLSNLEMKEAGISDRLTSAVEKENLLTLVGYSTKLQRKIQSLIKSQLEPELIDLQTKLEDLVSDVAREIDSDINEELALYSRSYPGNSLKGEIGTLIGGGIAGGGAIIGITAVTGALATISTTAIELAAVSSGGIFTAIKIIFVGNAAKGAFAGALIGGVVPIIGGIAVAALAYRFGTGFAKNQTIKNIPKMVEDQLKGAAASINYESEKMLDYVLSQLQDHLETFLSGKQIELEDTIEKVKTLNPEAQIKEIERDKEELEELSTNLTRLMNSIGA